YDMQLGLDLTAHLGISFDWSYVETGMHGSDGVKLGELTLTTAVPAIRARFPQANDRLTPWVSGGFGFAWLVANDRTPAGRMRVSADRRKHMTSAVSFAGGVDWFVRPNVALGATARYSRADREVLLADGAIDPDGPTTTGVGAFLSWGVLVRYYIPETAPGGLFRGVDWGSDDPDRLQPYFTGAVGVRRYLHRDVTPDAFLWSREDGEQASAVVLGLGFDRLWGVEISAVFHEANLWSGTRDDPGSKLVEIGAWVIAPQVHRRFDTGWSWLSPFVSAGVGIGLAETNDPAPANRTDPRAGYRTDDIGLAGSAGGGLDVKVGTNLMLLLDVRYVHHRSRIQRPDETLELDLSSLQFMAGARVYFR
ncbi:MAG: hypothetical protein OEU54_12465, partial [Gemmatimonadota bacterium]|nr:hypothetical protein [Gemmatimonadota bacterium]